MSSSQSNRIKKPTGPKTSGRAPTTAKGGNAAAFDGEKLGAHKSDALRLDCRCGQVRPNQPVVIGAQFLAGDFPASDSLNQHAEFGAGYFSARKDLIKVLLSNAALLSNFKSGRWGYFVHKPKLYRNDRSKSSVSIVSFL